jgi:energy-coupling factor transporter transmembrane protein EcfT
MINLNNNDKKSSRFIYLAIFFLAAYLSFTCLNFFTNRYLFSAILIVFVLTGYCLDMLLSTFKQFMVYPLIASILVIGALAFKNNTGVGDVDLSIYNSMQVQEDIVAYMEKNQLYNREISTHSSLQRDHLTKPLTGFRHTPNIFSKVNYNMQPSTEFVVIDNIEVDSTLDKSKLKTEFALLKRFEKGEVWAEIYKRR